MSFPESTVEWGAPSRAHIRLLSQPSTQPWAWHGGDLALVSLPAQSVHRQGARCQRRAQEPSPRLLGEGDVAGLKKINPFPRGADPSAATQRASPLSPGCYGPALCSHRGARRPAGCSEGTEPGAEGRSTPGILSSLLSASRPHPVSGASQALTRNLSRHTASIGSNGSFEERVLE